MVAMQPRHTAFPTSRAFSVQSFGSVSAVSHLSSTGINLQDAQTPKRFSGMPPLHDHSRSWCKQREARTPCWPLHRDHFGPAMHPEVDPWAEKCGHVSGCALPWPMLPSRASLETDALPRTLLVSSHARHRLSRDSPAAASTVLRPPKGRGHPRLHGTHRGGH